VPDSSRPDWPRKPRRAAATVGIEKNDDMEDSWGLGVFHQMAR
jgi:hypothetical protein